MSDYIKREDAVLAIVAFLRFTQPMARRIVDEIPSADVVDRESYESMERTVQKITDAIAKTEQKHGKWIEYPECLQYDNAYSDDHIVCSECCHVWSLLDNCTETFNYCPNCGAKMDGDS